MGCKKIMAVGWWKAITYDDLEISLFYMHQHRDISK